ncbi:hypothetical protein QO004_004489 [Rhizobium mesoamericanum]|uniref:hypothetical protein n=1 Tax=Rhizobium mesoamericanum TaxID=1079800 RepID=UPI0027830355|nr:hypothetical protein [Rhizobium mesoamericanum]MDQ0562684.1 hypothetical protein [Rhizobium mesoamericanum]
MDPAEVEALDAADRLKETALGQDRRMMQALHGDCQIALAAKTIGRHSDATRAGFTLMLERSFASASGLLRFRFGVLAHVI